MPRSHLPPLPQEADPFPIGKLTSLPFASRLLDPENIGATYKKRCPGRFNFGSFSNETSTASSTIAVVVVVVVVMFINIVTVRGDQQAT